MLLNNLPWQLIIIATLSPRLLRADSILKDWVGEYPHRTLIINEGDALEITCFTKKPVIFYYPTSNMVSGTSSFTTIKDEDDSGFSLYTFQRPKANHKDSGFYGCVEVNSTTINSIELEDYFCIPEPLNLTYFYVKSKKNAFAHGLITQITAWSEGSNMLVHCRPTSPDIHVELEHHLNGNKTIITTDKRVFWESKFGFVIKNVRPTGDNGIYICKANYNGHWQEVPQFKLTTNETFFNNPHIESDRKAIEQGMTINLNCTVTICNITKYDLNWITPQENKINNNIETKIHTSSTFDNNTLIKNQLTIINFSEDDEGDYKCNFVTFDNPMKGPEIKSKQKLLKIYDPNSSFINLHYDRAEKEFIRYPEEELLIIAKVDAYPTPNVQWLHPNGGEIKTSDKYDALNFPFVPRLLIKNIELNDAGVYSLRVSHEEETKVMNFTLTVKSA